MENESFEALESGSKELSINVTLYRIVRDDLQEDAITKLQFSCYDSAYDELERFYGDLCCSDERIEYSIISIDGIRDKNKIKHFVMYMPAADSKALRNFINKRLFEKAPILRFLPQHGRIASKWWSWTPEAIIAMLKLLGFEKTKVNFHYYKNPTSNGKYVKIWSFTVVGERTIPIEKCEYNYDAN